MQATIQFRNFVFPLPIKISCLKFIQLTLSEPIPVAARSKAWVCGHSLAGIVGSNPVGDMDVCLLWVLCVVGRGLCVGLITRPRESYTAWRVWVWSSSFDNEEDLAHYGVVALRRNIILSVLCECEDWILSLRNKHRLRVFEKSVIIWMEIKIRGLRNCIMRSSILCTVSYLIL